MPVTDASAAALRRGLVSPPSDATLVGLVRDPDPWLARRLDENHPVLAPTAALLADATDRAESLRMAGMCAEGAHNAAWEELGVLDAYRDRLDHDPDVRAAFDALQDRVRAGESLVVVDAVGPNRQCHRAALRERLACTERGR